MSKASDVVAIALAEVGYKEKASNADLDDMTANAGSANYTKYARDLANAGYYNGNKNGYAWCDVFVDWCFYKAFGATGQAIQCQTGDCGAGCTFSMQYYAAQSRLDMTPQVGDQVFFRYSGTSGADHTGLVVGVTAARITTVEGNSDNCVKKNSYAKTNSSIIGYGHPKYDEDITVAEVATEAPVGTVNSSTAVTVTLDELAKGSLGAQVKTIQRIMRMYGFDNTLEIDGEFGALTEASVIRMQKKLFPAESAEWDGIVGIKTWTAALTQLK